MPEAPREMRAQGEALSHGPGRFVTHRTRRLADGRHLVATSRRHRKSLPPYLVFDPADIHGPRSTRTSAFRRISAPDRLAWWIAILFGIGSALFLVGGIGAAWTRELPVVLETRLNLLFFLGSLFFTSAALLQWLEALNNDVAEALDDRPARAWRWFGWRPHNLGYLASAVQLVGTLFFNVSTADAMIPGLSFEGDDLFIWTPNMLGCICFLIASYLAYAEVSHGTFSFAPGSVSWWVAVINGVGSVAFQVSALYSFAGPAPATTAHVFWASFSTALGGACFLVGAYLLLPELFDE